MASQLIGRTACPECGFASAHVKRSERCLYRYCPECGAQYMATGDERAAALLAKTRLAAPASGPTPTGSDSAPVAADPAAPASRPATDPPATAAAAPATPPAAPAPAPKRRVGLFGIREASHG